MSKRLFVFLATALGTLAVLIRQQREREQDEAIWEEPRDL
ncbi:hypothetical protein BH20ACT9_BH20ACT9_04170 [soil metagenome]